MRPRSEEKVTSEGDDRKVVPESDHVRWWEWVATAGGMSCVSNESGAVSPRNARRNQPGNTVDQSLAIEITVHPRRPAMVVIGSCSFRVLDTLS